MKTQLLRLATVILVGCGTTEAPGERGQTPAPEPSGDRQDPSADLAHVWRAASASALASSEAQPTLERVVEALQVASIEATGGQQLVTSGTIMVEAEGGVSYTPMPADRLAIQTPSERFLVTVREVQGDLTRKPSDFFQGTFSIDVRIQRETAPVFDLDYGAYADNGLRRVVVEGTLVDNGAPYQVELEANLRTLSDVGGSFATLETEQTITGRITGPDYDAELSDFEYYKAIYNADISRSVENRNTTSDSTWRTGNKAYAWSDATIRRSKINGLAAEPDFWHASGTLFEDGVPIGALGIDKQFLGDGFTATIWVEVRGERTIVEHSAGTQ